MQETVDLFSENVDFEFLLQRLQVVCDSLVAAISAPSGNIIHVKPRLQFFHSMREWVGCRGLGTGLERGRRGLRFGALLLLSFDPVEGEASSRLVTLRQHRAAFVVFL